ncbi:zinc finger protein 185 isoform X5 [Arapaima gigas]
MSKEGDRQSVIRTTKVRTTLKADGSWIQRNSEGNPEQEEKQWLAEVKTNRTNGVFADLSPPTSPTATSAVAPASPTTTEGSKPTSGYLIRGVFTRTNAEKTTSVADSTSSTSTTFIKKPTEAYKKIAPHSVRLSSGNQVQDEDQLSPEEQSRRTEAASGVVRSSVMQQRSYVLSAAKKYEAADKPSEVVPSFIAKRVVINEEDEPTETQNNVEPPAPTPQNTVPKPASQFSTKDSKLAVQKTVPETSPTEPSTKTDTFTALSDTLFFQKTNKPSSKDTKLPVEQKMETNPVKSSSSDTKLSVEQKMKTETSPAKNSFPPKVQTALETSKNLDSGDLIALPDSSEKVVDPLPNNPKSSSLSTGSQSSTKTTTAVQSTMVITETNVTEQKTGGDTPSKKQTITTSVTKTSDGTVDMFDPFPVDTSKSVKEKKAGGNASSSQQSVTTTVTKISSTTSADPAPVRTLSIKSTIDPLAVEKGFQDTNPMEFSDTTVNLLDPFSVDTSKSPSAPASQWEATEDVQRTDTMKDGALDALAVDVIPFDNTRINTEKSLVSLHSKTERHSESPEGTADDPADLPNYFVTFERQSSAKNSPWDKWTSPTISEYREVRTYESNPSTMDSRTLETVSQETNSSDSESKKGLILVKEYVNTSAMSLQNTGIRSDERLSSDYIYSTSSNYSYSSPSSYSGSMSACTYCGKMVGSENRITIEHLNISCHPACFKCGVCSKPMGDLLHSMFLHRNTVHCENCYSNAI